jgi:hypothetical protein
MEVRSWVVLTLAAILAAGICYLVFLVYSSFFY